MKLALIFLALIALVAVGLPFSVAGDNSLTGAVQSFLTYGLTATGALLGLLTVFLSRSVADELVHRQLFLLVSKPVARWQYVVGKWLGITLLDATFLLCAGATMYGMVYYIKATHPPIDERYDEAELQNEVLVARHALQCKLPDFTRPAEAEWQRNLEDGLYENVPDVDEAEVKRRLAGKYETRWRFVGPQETRVFEFENVLCDRSPGKRLQIRYKTDVTNYPPDEVFRGFWRFGNAAKGTPVYQVPVRQAIGRYHTVQVPANCVAADHTLTARFFNVNPYEGEPQYRNVMEFRKSAELSVLFVVGSFEGNLIRLLVLMQCKLMFLAAVAILMTVVFSFPVACLASFTIYILAATRKFIAQALDMSSDDFSSMFTSVKEFFLHLIIHVYNGVHWIIPDFARYDAIESFVNGHNVSLSWVLSGVLWLVLVKTVVVLGMAVLLFHRREVAEVSF
ncbi:MAG: ABC transporter permease [Dehalococcoidia bacterium]